MKLMKINYMAITLLGCLLCSCMDNILLSTSTENNDQRTDKDMYLKVSVPRTYGSYAGENPALEENIQTLDVMVFAKGKADNQYYVKTASEGTPSATIQNQFGVVMPIGENLIVHVFANCHDDMVANGFYNSIGTQMDVMLKKLTLSAKVINDVENTSTKLESLPMHGYAKEVSVARDRTAPVNIKLLRSVAGVQVVTNATINKDNTIANTADITDEHGNIIFQMSKLYAYFVPTSACASAFPDSYKPLSPDAADETRDVEKVSLPQNLIVTDIDNPVITNKTTHQEQRTKCLYLYENKPYSTDGSDYPDVNHAAATTRLVVGGVYKGIDHSNTKVTYYRIDFTNAQTHKLDNILRNHKYTFNIISVSGPGYDNPKDAATGVPINITVNPIEWTSVWDNIDFDGENYLSTETKNIVLPRDKQSTKTISMESDVALGDQWTLAFDNKAINGNGGLAEVKGTQGSSKLSISNSRYQVDITQLPQEAQGMYLFKLKVTVRKFYNENTEITAVPPTEAYDDELTIKIKNLTAKINLSQVDKSPADWGNGGDQNTDL